jgi:hypothetical protein
MEADWVLALVVVLKVVRVVNKDVEDHPRVLKDVFQSKHAHHELDHHVDLRLEYALGRLVSVLMSLDDTLALGKDDVKR